MTIGELAIRYQGLQRQLAAMYTHDGVSTERLNQVANQIHETELALLSVTPPDAGLAEVVRRHLPRDRTASAGGA